MRQNGARRQTHKMFRKLIKTLLIFALCAVIATVIGWYVPVLLCDVWQLPWEMCQ